jgi:hypothetical protein
MSEKPDTVAIFRRRMRAYFVRVVALLFLVTALLLVVLRWLAPLQGDRAGLALGIVALVGAVGGSYVVHWKTVRCPACERWLIPLGINGFAPRFCPHCKAELR